MNPLIIVLLPIATFALSALFTYRFCNPDSLVYTLDHPTDRSLHDRPVPRGGGLAILIAITTFGTAASLFDSARDLAGIAVGVFIVAGVSFFDDRHSVSPFYRLVVHGLAALIVCYGGFFLHRFELPGASWNWSYAVGSAFSILFVVWMINLYNFMDGMDGFAGGMAVFGFSAFAIMGWLTGHGAYFVMSLIVAAASAGFLIFNFPPARIFMGDIGSSTLGLLAATFSLWGARDGIFPFWVSVLVFSPFIADATVTLLRRLWQREKIWQAHKTHYYQQLVQAGWGHRRTVLLEYVVMLGCSASVLWGFRAAYREQAMLLVGWSLFYAFFFFWVAHHAAKYSGTIEDDQGSP